jgi:hypothetical protein
MQAAAAAQAGMNNADVIALVGAGMSDDIVLAKIHAARSTAFDISIQGLTALKNAGVSTAVIKVMIDPSAGTGQAAAVDPDDPMTPHTGFYMETMGADGKVHLEKILLTNTSGVKGPSFGSALGTAYSFGIHKSKVKMIIPGTKAEAHTTNTSPTFWIYPAGDMSIGNTELVKLEVKKETREATGASIGVFTGFSVGGAQGDGRQLKIDKVKDGVYKVTVMQPLQPGSYAFIQGTGGSYRDFDITAAP